MKLIEYWLTSERGMNMETNMPPRRYYDIGLQIEALLHNGSFKNGQRLPSERELSEKFDTSRAIIREAMIMLELKGLVEVRKGAGIFFVDNAQSINSKSLIPFSEIGPFELLQARQVIETQITGFAAKKIGISHLRDLKAIIDKQEREVSGDSNKFEELDRQFHNVIAEATQNRVLIRQSADLWRAVRTENPLWKRLNHSYLHKAELQEQWISDHRAILTALQMRDSDAAIEAAYQHIENGKNELKKLLDLEDSNCDFEDVFFAN